MGSSCPPSDDLSVMVLASDLGIDARPFLSKQQDTEIEEQEQEQWHDCAQYLSPDEDFSDLDSLQFFCLQGSDKSGNRIFRLVGKYFPGNQTPSSPRVYIIIRLCFLKKKKLGSQVLKLFYFIFFCFLPLIWVVR